MKKNSFKTLFFVKPSRILRNGESPVFMRITIDGQRGKNDKNDPLRTGQADPQKLIV